MSVILKSDHCPQCGRELNAATYLKEIQRPSPGDLSVCFYCGTLLQFDTRCQLQKLSVLELMELPDDTRYKLLTVKQAIDKMRRVH